MPSHNTASRLRFFGQWLKNPLQTAAIAPSGPELAAAMLAELPEGARRVIELGGGTGAITQALIEHGLRQQDVLVLELNEELHAHLRERFPRIALVLGDAADLPRLAESNGYLADGHADAVISGLGLLTMDRETQARILQAGFDCLREGGVFVQFTYGPISPVSDDVLAGIGLKARRGEFVLRNVPPATVWVYSRSRTRGIRPRTVVR